MKILKNIIMNTFYTFSVLSIVIGILCKVNVFKNLPYTEIVFSLFFMCIGTTIFVTVREVVIPESVKVKYLIDILGCSAISILISHFIGWLEVSVLYLLTICVTVLSVYLLVWLITWFQSKQDEQVLNGLLKKQLDVEENKDK